MTLESYWMFSDIKQESPNDPLIVKWIEKLGLRNENITIVRKGSNGYASITLHYDRKSQAWIISLDFTMKLYHAIHKLGYLWLWNNAGILPKMKVYWKTREYAWAESCVLDNIVFYRFCNMDRDFKDFWIDFTLEEGTHFYNGASWNKTLPLMIYQYIVNYLNYNYVLPEEKRNQIAHYIMVEFLVRKKNFLDKTVLEGVDYSQKDFRRLHKLLRQFDIIKDTIDYKKIQDFITQIFFYFPLKTEVK